VREQKLFSEINAYIMGDFDEGLFVISGKLNEGVEMKSAENGLDAVLKNIQENTIQEQELEKVKNKVEATKVFNDMSVLDKAMELCFFELLGDAAMVNQEIEKYRAVTSNDIKAMANQLLRPENCSTLYYLAKRK
jgi:predicted Zn-dependent peptidase